MGYFKIGCIVALVFINSGNAEPSDPRYQVCENSATADVVDGNRQTFYNFQSAVGCITQYPSSGVCGYCNSIVHITSHCTTLHMTGKIRLIDPWRPHPPGPDQLPEYRPPSEAVLRNVTYRSCDAGFQYLSQREAYEGKLCQALERFHQHRHGNSNNDRVCYTWKYLRGATFTIQASNIPGYGQPLRQYPQYHPSTYQLVLDEGSISIYCCKDSNKCNSYSSTMPNPNDNNCIFQEGTIDSILQQYEG